MRDGVWTLSRGGLAERTKLHRVLLGLEEPLAGLLQLQLELHMQESLVVGAAVHGGRVKCAGASL